MVSKYFRCLILLLSLAATSAIAESYETARWSPLHFKPAIDGATNEQCLACHREVLSDAVQARSAAGVGAADSLAWYQRLSIYEGPQETFHRRHLVTPLSKSLMDLRCVTCHQGSDPREQLPPAGQTGFTMRKTVNPETTCLKCHGQMDWKLMGLPGPWRETGKLMGGSCLLCHAAIRTSRHNVDYLNADAIEQAGKANSEVCYGCHGGRAWYRIPYPYARHPWPGMPEQVPDWARKRPTASK